MLKNKKSWLLSGLLATIVFVFTPFIIQAADSWDTCGDISGKPLPNYFPVMSASTTPQGGVLNAEGCVTNIVNNSGRSYFVPNKSLGEFNSFVQHAPNYVSVAVCGDGVLSEGESCVRDSNRPELDYCGDGTCNSQTVCSTETVVDIPARFICNRNFPGWAFSNIWFLITNQDLTSFCVSAPEVTKEVTTCKEVGSENWNTCPDDCLPTAGDGCGVCGYDGNGDICPNRCGNGGYNFVNCIRKDGSEANYLVYKDNELNLANEKNNFNKYFGVNSVFAYSAPIVPTTRTYSISEAWGCAVTPDSLPCPEGKYCQPGGLAQNTQYICPPGRFCPLGSYYPRICPPGTFSHGGLSWCTKCPAGTYSAHGSTSIDACKPVFSYGDGVCNLNTASPSRSENPVNSYRDCPDVFSKGAAYNSSNPAHTRQLAFYGDGRCSGVETADFESEYYSPDCFCGNGYCDNDETIRSCYIDCSCGNNKCDSKNSLSIPVEATGLDECSSSQGFNCKYCADCSCGDGICDTSETKTSCPRDCHCGADANGDGNKCDSMSPYNESYGNCSADCKCGDGECGTGETSLNCSIDCKCGNGKCEPEKGERRGTCSDCTGTDGICDPLEVFGQTYFSRTDCHCGVDANLDHNYCDSASPYKETTINCPEDCGTGGLRREPIYPK